MTCSTCNIACPIGVQHVQKIHKRWVRWRLCGKCNDEEEGRHERECGSADRNECDVAEAE